MQWRWRWTGGRRRSWACVARSPPRWAPRTAPGERRPPPGWRSRRWGRAAGWRRTCWGLSSSGCGTVSTGEVWGQSEGRCRSSKRISEERSSRWRLQCGECVQRTEIYILYLIWRGPHSTPDSASSSPTRSGGRSCRWCRRGRRSSGGWEDGN